MNKLPFIVRIGIIALVIYVGYAYGGVNVWLLLFAAVSSAILAEVFYWRKMRPPKE